MARPQTNSVTIAKGLRVFRPRYAGADGQTVAAGRWWVEFRFHDHPLRVPGFTDRGETEGLARQLQQLAWRRQANEPLTPEMQGWVESMSPKLREKLVGFGVLDALRQAAAKPLADHLKDWKQSLLAAGNTPEYAACRQQRVTRVFEKCGLVQWSDLTKPGVASTILCYLGELRKRKRGKEGGISGASINHYCNALRGFGNWMVTDKRATHNPLANLHGVHDAETDANHERRHLTAEELRRLLVTTETENVTRDVPAADRCLFYRFQYEAGLRPGQTRSLTVSSFDLDAAPPTVTSEAKYNKRRRRHEQVITPALAAELRDAFANKLPAASAFTLPGKYKLAEVFKADLAAARKAWVAEASISDKEREQRQRSDFLEYRDHQGRVADCYSLRHSHGTLLAESGASAKDIQASLHHTSGRTTERYLHATRRGIAGALAGLPSIAPEPKPDAQAIRATGTFGKLGDTEYEKTCRESCRGNRDNTGVKRDDSTAQASGAGHTQPLEKHMDAAENQQELSFGPLAELADAMDSKSIVRKDVSVRLR